MDSITHEQAEGVVQSFRNAAGLCDDAIRVVKQHETLGVVQVFVRLAGRFMGHSYTNILAPLWRMFPDLEPAEMRQPYVKSEPVLSPESQQALRLFVAGARAAMERASDAVRPGAAEDVFRFGGLPEVTAAIGDIEQFLAAPRERDGDGQA